MNNNFISFEGKLFELRKEPELVLWGLEDEIWTATGDSSDGDVAVFHWDSSKRIPLGNPDEAHMVIRAEQKKLKVVKPERVNETFDPLEFMLKIANESEKSC